MFSIYVICAPLPFAGTPQFQFNNRPCRQGATYDNVLRVGVIPVCEAVTKSKIKVEAKSKSANEVKSVAAIEAEIELLEEQRERADARRREEAKPKLTAEQAKVQKERDEFYAEHKEKIDKELKNCTGHLRKLDIQVAREAIRRLEAYYLKHGIN